MSNIRTVLLCAAATLFMSIPLLMRVPRMLPFADQHARAAAPAAIHALRMQGIWVVNAKFQKVSFRDTLVCFDWKHRYRARGRVEEPEFITTCIEP